MEPPHHLSPTRADRVIGSLLVGSLGGFGGGALASIPDAGTRWIVAGAVVGCLLAITLCWLTWDLAVQSSRAFNWATEESTAPHDLGEAIKGALRRQKGYLAFDAICRGILLGGPVGGLLGAGLLSRWGSAPALLGALAGAVVGSAFLATLEFLFEAASTALAITVGCTGPRTFGVTFVR